MYFKQIPIGGYDNNLIYLFGASKDEVAVVDPVEIPKLLEIANTEGIGKISAVFITHSHQDHIAGTPELLETVGEIPVYIHESGINELTVPCTGISDGDVVRVCGVGVKVHHTPGHRFDSVCYEVEENLVTGDTLFVDGCGRCDLPGSDVEAQYESLHVKLAALAPSLKVWPGHDYGSTKSSTLEKEFANNPYLTVGSKADFINLRIND